MKIQMVDRPNTTPIGQDRETLLNLNVAVCAQVYRLFCVMYMPLFGLVQARPWFRSSIGHCRNVRGLGKSMVVFRLFEKLICSNERSTKFESLYHGQKYLAEENGKMVALKISPKIDSLYGLGRQATKL